MEADLPERVREICRKKGVVTSPIIEEELTSEGEVISVHTVKIILSRLEMEGILEKLGSGKRNGRPFRYKYR